jgi:aromatic-L-amino-acid decarboxylase
MTTGGFPLEPSEAEMRAMGEAALSLVIEHIASLPDAPASDLEGASDLAKAFDERAPDGGTPFAELLERLRPAFDKALGTTGPGYMAFIPGGGLYVAALADLVANVFNRYTGMWAPAPVLGQIEWSVIRWLADLFGYPPEARGTLTSGGSMANFSAVVTARRAKLGDEFHDGTLYVTEHTHASVQKAAVLAGFSTVHIKTVPTTRALTMDTDALRGLIAEDRQMGHLPFLVVASAGTTNTGAVDPLEELADLCAAENMWLHADAAYGGFFYLTKRGRTALAGIERADSITLDPHKAMFMPYGTGALLVREGNIMHAAHTTADAANYLQDLATAESVDSSDYSAELTRPFRGLKIWLAVQLHGMRAFREALEEKMELTRVLHDGLRAIPGIEIPWEPSLTIVAFRLEGADNDANRAFLERINATKRVFLSSTIIDGRFTLRACIVSHRTHRDRIEEAIEIIAASARA